MKTSLKCKCEEMSCKTNCDRNHTHKGFYCEKCNPEMYQQLKLEKEVIREMIKEPEEGCSCVCHRNLLKKPYTHDTECCKNMNGFIYQEPSPDWATEATERIVIQYANLSGRESAHRAEFREKVQTILEQTLDEQRKLWEKGCMFECNLNRATKNGEDYEFGVSIS